MKTLYFMMFVLCFSVMAHAQSNKQHVALVLKDIRGRSFSLSDYKGDVVLVNFWATWCVPCRTEIPDLIRKQRKYRNQGLRIIGITYPPETLSEVRRFAKNTRMNYRVVLGDKATKAVFSPSETLPITVVIDRDGMVRDVIEGTMYQDEFDEKVKPLLSTTRVTLGSSRQKRKPIEQQRVTIIVGAQAYRPSSVTLRRGVPAELTFIRKIEQTCGRDIVIPAYGINRPLPLDTPVVIQLTPKRSGRFKFTCGMDMFRGALLVR